MTITALPAPPSRANPTTFSDLADALLNALPTFVTEANATAAAMNLNATTSVSSTSITIGIGAKTLTVELAKSYQVGMYVIIARTSVPTTWMHGVVTAYNPGTGVLAVTVDLVNGSGTITDWTITLSAPTQLSTFASGAELIAGTESGKSIAPDVLKANLFNILSNASVRQTVLSGPDDISGLPTFLPASATGLNLVSQNITSSWPFVVSAANGSGQGGEINNIGISAANITWSSLTNSATLFLYVTISNGVLTTGFTVLAPIYQEGGTPSTTNGQATFNISEKKMYLGNGATAPQANIVFVGKAVTSGGNITSTVMYAYNGRSVSAEQAVPTGTTVVSVAHNIGTLLPKNTKVFLRCKTGELGFSSGDEIDVTTAAHYYSGVGQGYCSTISDQINITWAVNMSVSPLVIYRKDTGAGGSITTANWKLVFIASRGW